MTDAEPHPAVLIAVMRGDRGQAVMAGIPAADLAPNLGRRKLQLVLEHRDFPGRELEEVPRFLHRAPRLVHVGRRFEQDHALMVDCAFRGLALKAAAPWCETMTPRNF